MKRILNKIMLAGIILLLITAVGCQKDEFAPPKGMEHAADPLASFYLYVPEEWEVDYTRGTGGAYFSDSDPSSISVMAWALPNTDTKVEDWWTTNVSELEKVFDDFALVEEKNVTVDEAHGKSYTYTASLAGVDYKYMQVAFVKDGSVYLLTYTSIPENFDSHLEDVAEMLEFLTVK
ncbi:MAG: hypothetical protein E7627_06165 [Ruminococcaceae bacterium]|nr:hypothetical protein [Oscillospiraceae bacterium]